MIFQQLYNEAVNGKKYEFNIERHPDFEQPARYLKSIIQPISVLECIDDVLNIAEDVIVPLVLQQGKHIRE
jgi:hypothetical protein